jgi:hypothetical protein
MTMRRLAVLSGKLWRRAGLPSLNDNAEGPVQTERPATFRVTHLQDNDVSYLTACHLRWDSLPDDGGLDVDYVKLCSDCARERGVL